MGKAKKKKLKVVYLPHQIPVFDSTERNVVYVKGRRAGGTLGAVNRLIEIAHEKPGSRHLWVDTVQRDTDFADSNYNVVGTGGDFTDSSIITHTHAVGSFKVACRRVEAAVAYDDQLVQLQAFGNQ